MPETPCVAVTVVYAERGHAFSAALSLPMGATVADAIEASGIRRARPDVEVRADRVGIFARRVTLAARVQDGDRVEIYRPLRIDPKEARRRRAREPSAIAR